MKSGIGTAIEFLRDRPEEYYTPENLHSICGLKGIIGIPALARRLRQKRTDRILQSKLVKNLEGEEYTVYSFLADKPKKEKQFYFFTIPITSTPSGQYPDLESCRKGLSIWRAGNIWTGSHDKPIHVETIK